MLYNKGVVLKKLEKDAEAEEYLNKYIKIAPKTQKQQINSAQAIVQGRIDLNIQKQSIKKANNRLKFLFMNQCLEE